MIINHNLTALNTFNSLTKNTNATQKSLQKLSSGLRINSAADDAAGLAISEKMKGQISGLEQASRNSQDGISLLQTAEGGLDQTHSILQRMRQLAVQSATDTNTADDRTKIQAEVDQLAKEITRISNVTAFNTQNLLAGGMSGVFHVGANANENMTVSISAMDAATLGVAGSVSIAASVASANNLNITGLSRGLPEATAGRYTVTAATAAARFTATSTLISKTAVNFSGVFSTTAVTHYTGTVDANYLIKVSETTTSGASVTAIQYSTDEGVTWTALRGNFTNASVAVDGVKINFQGIANNTVAASTRYNIGDEWGYSVAAAKATLQLKDTSNKDIGAAVVVHKGDTKATVGDQKAGETVDLNFAFANITAATIGFNVNRTNSTAAAISSGVVQTQATAVAGIDMTTQANANLAITAIDNAIKTVSVSRSQLGAYENRLTNTIANLNTSDENITAAQSRIADVDMASEISAYQKNNVLQQSATAMLAHANQQPQTVLQLLQG